MRLALALVLVACGGPDTSDYDCKTACGTKVKGGDCGSLSGYEQHVIKTFEDSGLWPQQSMCRVLGEYWLQVVPNTEDRLEAKGAIGLTECSYGAITLARHETWPASPYAHELVHAFRCSLDHSNGDPDHSYWRTKGYFRAIVYAKDYGLQTADMY